MSRTHILAGEGNVGYTDFIGSPVISVVMETTKCSAVCTGCINENIKTINAPWHMTSLDRVGKLHGDN